MSLPYPSRETIAIPSTGDTEEDLRQIDAAVLHEKRIAEGMCPNGCGPLAPTRDEFSRWDADCAKCGFHLSCNQPHNLPEPSSRWS